MPADHTRAEKMKALRQQVQHFGREAGGAAARVSSGCRELDRWLPDEGFRRGTLVEWFGSGSGEGAGTLALLIAREAAQEGKAVVVLDRRGEFYPPAAAALGLDLSRLVVLRPAKPQDELWALDQALRCPAVAAVWGALEGVDWRSFRRLQLAAEGGGTLGLLLRPAAARQQPSWAHLGLGVEPCPTEDWQPGRQWRVELLRGGQGREGQTIEVTWRIEGGAGPPSGEERAGKSAEEGRYPVLSLARPGSHASHPMSVAPPMASAAAYRGSA